MKIFNIKLSFKTIIFIVLVIIVLLSIVFLYGIFNNNRIVMNNKNYADILKDVHDNTYDYLGKKISLTGYIYRVNDLNENQFVIARNMMISDYEYRIVGFLCEYDKAEEFENYTWVKASGTIDKTNYHGLMPIIKINKIHKTITPINKTILPPI